MMHLPTVEQLTEFVRRVLCGKADLELDTPMLTAPLMAGGAPCGLEFTVIASRSVRLSAIWETIENRILFYDENLQRFDTIRVKGPDPKSIRVMTPEEPILASVWSGK